MVKKRAAARGEDVDHCHACHHQLRSNHPRQKNEAGAKVRLPAGIWRKHPITGSLGRHLFAEFPLVVFVSYGDVCFGIIVRQIHKGHVVHGAFCTLFLSRPTRRTQATGYSTGTSVSTHP
jgi:hypothetical protein